MAVNVNASLIHEIRMAYQHILEAMRLNKAVSKGANSALKCVFCLAREKKFKDAITIQQGNAVCQKHVL